MNGNKLDPNQLQYLMMLLSGKKPQPQGPQMDENMLLNLLQQDPYNQRQQLAFGRPRPQVAPGAETSTTGIRGRSLDQYGGV